jgi:ubiquinol-cytochrome c reductase cytochrome b subunit
MSRTEPVRPKPAPLVGPMDRWLRPTGVTLGQLVYAALAVTVVSGVVLGLVYDPSEPLASTEAIQGGVAYGFLVRAAHNLGGQLFVVTLLLHTVDHVIFRSYRVLSPGDWWRLVLVAGLGLGAMFSGFLLRGDGEARAAQAIAVSVVRVVPGVGEDLSRMLFGDADGPLHAVYLHHLVTFSLVPWLVAVAHARRVWAGAMITALVAAAVTAVALVYHPGPGLPPGMARGALWGPWYFIGAQELLHHIPVVWVTVVGFVGAVGILGGLGHVPSVPGDRWRLPDSIGHWVWLLGLAAYLVVCLVAYLVRGTA